MKREMFYKADPLVFENARKLRNNLTPAEQTFWLRLKEQFPAYKFRRQHPISIYIADFYCHKLKLVIEIDGPIHNSNEAKLNDEKDKKS
jgi:cyclase